MISAGQSIGNYRILNKIGTGGMGAVYLAEHPLIGKRVALKVIHRELVGNRDVVSRFFQEARAVNTIGNDHIVEIHDFGVTPEGDHFFIMEYLDGKTLASILTRERTLGIMRSLHVGAQIASALAAAHAAGILHRDLKPDNIMLLPRLGDQDFVKVLDFGLAKVFSAETAVKTAAGVLLGTPQYMSPEACESRGDVDHRTDIYALGVLLFQMTTGVLPFDGESMGEVLVKQVTALPPAPRGVNPEIPPSVEQILLRCLAKRVDARFATMMQLREALLDPEAYLRGSPPIAAASSVQRAAISVDSSTMVAQRGPQTARHAAANPYPVAGRPTGPATAATMLGASASRTPAARPTSGMTALAPPQEPTMNTMRIATPPGYSSRPARRVWPIVVAAALLLGVAGGIAVTRGSRGGEPDGAGSDVAGGSAAAIAGSVAGGGGIAELAKDTGAAAGDATAATGAGSERAAPPAMPGVVSAPAPRLTHLSIDSTPPGATVLGPSGELLGPTPLKIEWPISDQPVSFEIALGGYKKRQHQFVVSGNTAVHVQLERLATGRRGGPGSSKSPGIGKRGNPDVPGGGAARSGSGANDLMRPDP